MSYIKNIQRGWENWYLSSLGKTIIISPNWLRYFCIKKLSIIINPLPDDKILKWSKLKSFAGDKFNVKKNDNFCLWYSRKHCEKRKNCLYSNFSFSNNVFQKPSFPEASKEVIEWEWVTDTKLTRDYDPIKKDSISALHPDKPPWIQKNNKSNFHHIFFFRNYQILTEK